MLSADTLAGEVGSGAQARGCSSQVVEEDRLLAALAAESLSPVTLGLALLYFALAPMRLVLIPAPAGGALALTALVSAVCLVLSFIDQRRNALDPDRAHRLLALCALLVVADFLYYARLAPGGYDVAMLCLILVASGFLVLSTPRLLRVIGLAVGGFCVIRFLSSAEFDSLGWPLAVLPATIVSLLGHHLRLRAVRAQAALMVQSRLAEQQATESAQRLAIALRSQQRLREVLESSPDVVRILSPEGEVLYENRSSRALTERARPAPAASGSVLMRYPEWAAKRLIDQVLPHVDRHGSWSGESALVDAGGTEIPMSQVVLAHRNTRGDIEAYSTVMRDMTAQKASERDLRRELQVSDTLARIGRELLETRGTTPLLERACRLACEFLGCDSTQTFLFREHDDAYVAIAATGDPPDVASWMASLRLPRVWLPGLLARLRREKWLDLRVGGGSDDEQDIDGLIGSDRTEARELVQRLQASGVQRLGLLALWRGERMIGFQTACYRSAHRPTREQVKMARGFAHLVSLALENAQLVRELEHANALKSDFVSVVSHELRSPLNIVLGYVDLLVDGAFGDLNEEQCDTLRRIEQQGLQLLDHINETLDFGRLEAGRTVVQREAISVEELCWELDAESRPLIEQREPDVVVRIAIADGMPEIHSDREKLKVVLKNLLGNALKFTAAGRVDIHASPRNGGVEFTVRDTGSGIPQEELVSIFEPFRQLKTSRTNGCKGVGLGLNIAQRFVALLGGTIEVESEVAKGSTFRVWVPAGVPAAAAIAA
jgi:signal transduction histidine kinase/PAS domain-containing protein